MARLHQSLQHQSMSDWNGRPGTCFVIPKINMPRRSVQLVNPPSWWTHRMVSQSNWSNWSGMVGGYQWLKSMDKPILWLSNCSLPHRNWTAMANIRNHVIPHHHIMSIADHRIVTLIRSLGDSGIHSVGYPIPDLLSPYCWVLSIVVCDCKSGIIPNFAIPLLFASLTIVANTHYCCSWERHFRNTQWPSPFAKVSWYSSPMWLNRVAFPLTWRSGKAMFVLSLAQWIIG